MSLNEKAKSQAQRGLIFGKRNQYKTKAKTPEKWQWIWDEEWENKGKLPKKVKNETVQNVVFNESNTRARFVNEWEDPRDYNGEVWGWLENALTPEEFEQYQYDLELNQEIDLGRVNGYSAEDTATQILSRLLPGTEY